MVLTKAQTKDAMTYILEKIFMRAADSPLHCAKAHNNIESLHDFISLDDSDLSAFKYPLDDKTLEVLPPGSVGLLKTFKAFIVHQASNGNPIGDSDWEKIDPDDFNQFRIGPN